MRSKWSQAGWATHMKEPTSAASAEPNPTFELKNLIFLSWATAGLAMHAEKAHYGVPRASDAGPLAETAILLRAVPTGRMFRCLPQRRADRIPAKKLKNDLRPDRGDLVPQPLRRQTCKPTKLLCGCGGTRWR